MIIKPEVGNSHPVLREGPCLVRADDGSRAKRFHSFQVLHQAVLLCHPFGCQRQAHLVEVKQEVQLAASEIPLKNDVSSLQTATLTLLLF